MTYDAKLALTTTSAAASAGGRMARLSAGNISFELCNCKWRIYWQLFMVGSSLVVPRWSSVKSNSIGRQKHPLFHGTERMWNDRDHTNPVPCAFPSSLVYNTS